MRILPGKDKLIFSVIDEESKDLKKAQWYLNRLIEKYSNK